MPALMRQYSALRLLRVTAACIIMKNYCIPELSTKSGFYSPECIIGETPVILFCFIDTLFKMVYII